MTNKKSLLVIGSNGQLGRSFKEMSTSYKDYQFTFTTRDELDLYNSEAVNEYFNQRHFDIVINCAAYTAVDKAEDEAEAADMINHLAVKQLAEISQKQDSILIHVSTDYVYDGMSSIAYQEDNETNPQNVYGLSKLKGEQAINETKAQAIIIRTSWVYSEYGNNFVKTMLNLGRQRDQLNIIFDQIGSPTYAKDLANCILQMVAFINNKPSVLTRSAGKVSVYHFSNEGACSWYDFAKAIFELSKINCEVSPIETKDYPTAAKRPHFSVLNKNKIKSDFNLSIPYWKDSLQKCLNIIQES